MKTITQTPEMNKRRAYSLTEAQRVNISQAKNDPARRLQSGPVQPSTTECSNDVARAGQHKNRCNQHARQRVTHARTRIGHTPSSKLKRRRVIGPVADPRADPAAATVRVSSVN